MLALASTLAPAAVPTFIGQNLAGSQYNVDSASVPPDTTGAAGPNHFVEFINGRFSVYNKTNGTRVKTLTDLAFWSALGITFPTNYDLTDPRLVYDPTVQRWFAVEIDFDPSGAQNTNRFLLAVSATSDPTGLWRGVAFLSDPGGSLFADFPGLGVDADGVYLSGDYYNGSSQAVRPVLVSLPKADLLANPPSAARRKFFSNLTYAANGVILQPAVCVDGSASGAVLAVSDLGNDFAPHTTLKGLFITNATTAAPALTPVQTLTVPAYTIPINPPQPGNLTTLDDGDTRFSAATRVVNGVLYAVHNVEVNTRAALRWYRVNATNFNVIESGTITDPVLDLFYPSIAANATGTIVIGCNGCSATNFIGAYACVGATVNGVTTFNSPLLLKAGTASYQLILGTDTTSRWGDYSATSPDPADPNRFWTIQMIPVGAQTWRTQITEIITGAPALSLSLMSGNATLSWPAYAATMQLQGNPSAVNTSTWSTLANAPITNGNQLTVTLPASAPAQFFRLRQ